MTSTSSIHYATEARPYAKAAFEFAKADKTLPQWKEFLLVADQIMQNSDIQSLLSSPKLMADQKADVVIEVFKSLQKKMDESQENFIRLVAQNGRFNLLPSISALYQNYLASLDKLVSVKVITAFPIEAQQQAKLVKALEKKFQSNIEMCCEEDRELLGGALVYIGDQVIDSSIRGRLTQLKSALLED